MTRQVTRRQHHVWRHYLEAWTNGGQLYCRDPERIFKLNPRHAAVETDFYKLNTLTAGDIALLERLIESSPQQSRAALENFVRMFSVEHRPRSTSDGIASGIGSEAAVRKDQIQAEEDYHARVEARALKTLNALRSGDIQILPDGSELLHFCYFLAVQMFRTKGLKERVLSRMKMMDESEYLTSNSWNIQSHIYAANVGFSIYAARASAPVRVVRNNTDRPFITGDQPVVNLYGKGDGLPPIHMAIYYPISPRFAVFIDDIDQPLNLHTDELREAQVLQLNAHIKRVAHRQIYGATHSCLDSL
ncbi:uncharacterized protein DUF4238 [Acidovorax sp. 100]|uniref:DUF4238 domain-containing protein n=1 Tax=Acidovorax sp. 100 TaxID=2135635 RepID=UPI000EF990AA|nr:DUF4238 domain-containing protein [Acidovorax sp. 100]RMA59362.1 uncharacterized protein DUF4238 [Acidovorax sp. 100]